MFSIFGNQNDRNCQGVNRREFLQVGGLGLLGGLTLPMLMQAKAQAAAAGSPVRDKAVVFLFLSGGPSHFEFFDPKMDAPAEIRSITGETRTTLPGITFGGTMTRLASMAEKLAVVRSYATGRGDHTYLLPASGDNALKATMGALYARVAGVNQPRTGMPNNVLILPEAVQRGLRLQGNFETGALPTLTAPGDLGASYRAFDPSGSSEVQRNMQLRIAPERLEDRRYLLDAFDTMRRDIDNRGVLAGADRFRQQAFDVISRGVARAFDLSREDPRLIDRYDTARFFRNEDVQRYYDMRRASNYLGKQMLLARRLVEAGCGFVTVSDCGWDMHANENSPRNMTALPGMSAQVDHAVATFLEDLEDRGMSDKVLLVVTGEMGRTPRRNGNGGRDHWGNLTSLLLAGGGLRMGQVIGRSDRIGGSPATERFGPPHLLATVMHTLLDIGEVRVQRELGRVANVISDGTPIAGLVS
ncbi:MAG: DUF1501 domain-containing protein [Planctomycetes bacterium]|nr:DUF1501 domain-containing protein [Planctomycetota bacterium]